MTESDSITISGNSFESNSSSAGGAMYLVGSSPLVRANQFFNNSAYLSTGGAVYCLQAPTPEFRDNLFVGNTSAGTGGAISLFQNSNAIVVGNTMSGNQTSLDGGGIYITDGSNPTIDNNIIVSSTGGDGVHLDLNATIASFNCNDVWNNTPTNYVGFADPTGTNGNISQDPIFCDLGSDDYHISGASPCAPGNSPGNCGLIGALGVQCGVVAVNPGTRAASALSLFPPVPNPANRATRIRFSISQIAPVSLRIHDAGGRLVRTVWIQKWLDAGEYSWQWDRRDDSGHSLSPGVYFISLENSKQRESSRVILLP